jgi:hypothetical protein
VAEWFKAPVLKVAVLIQIPCRLIPIRPLFKGLPAHRCLTDAIVLLGLDAPIAVVKDYDEFRTAMRVRMAQPDDL